jgi:hypothetical protein
VETGNFGEEVVILKGRGFSENKKKKASLLALLKKF